MRHAFYLTQPADEVVRVLVALCCRKPEGDPRNIEVGPLVDCPKCLEWVHG